MNSGPQRWPLRNGRQHPVGIFLSAVLFGGRLPIRDVAVAALALSGMALLVESLMTRGDSALLPEPEVDSPLITVITEPSEARPPS